MWFDLAPSYKNHLRHHNFQHYCCLNFHYNHPHPLNTTILIVNYLSYIDILSVASERH